MTDRTNTNPTAPEQQSQQSQSPPITTFWARIHTGRRGSETGTIAAAAGLLGSTVGGSVRPLPDGRHASIYTIPHAHRGH